MQWLNARVAVLSLVWEVLCIVNLNVAEVGAPLLSFSILFGGFYMEFEAGFSSCENANKAKGGHGIQGTRVVAVPELIYSLGARFRARRGREEGEAVNRMSGLAAVIGKCSACLSSIVQFLADLLSMHRQGFVNIIH